MPVHTQTPVACLRPRPSPHAPPPCPCVVKDTSSQHSSRPVSARPRTILVARMLDFKLSLESLNSRRLRPSQEELERTRAEAAERARELEAAVTPSESGSPLASKCPTDTLEAAVTHRVSVSFGPPRRQPSAPVVRWAAGGPRWTFCPPFVSFGPPRRQPTCKHATARRACTAACPGGGGGGGGGGRRCRPWKRKAGRLVYLTQVPWPGRRCRSAS